VVQLRRLVLGGAIPQGSPVQSILTIPEIIWELFLGLWLTFKGFRALPMRSGDTRPVGISPAAAVAAG
jgi:hypothetical protein